MIDRFDNIPLAYNANSPTNGPHQMLKLFMDYLAKNYGFSEETEYVNVISHPTLNGIERDASSDMESETNSLQKQKLVFDEKFTFDCKD